MTCHQPPHGSWETEKPQQEELSCENSGVAWPDLDRQLVVRWLPIRFAATRGIRIKTARRDSAWNKFRARHHEYGCAAGHVAQRQSHAATWAAEDSFLRQAQPDLVV